MNKKITDGNYDKSLAIKCINGTFVGQKSENIISYKGIPFVGQQPVADLQKFSVKELTDTWTKLYGFFQVLAIRTFPERDGKYLPLNP